TENGAKIPVKAPANFRLVFTQNPAEMQGGRKQHSPALENKFRKIVLRDPFTKPELERIVARELHRRLGPKPSPSRPKGGPPSGVPPAGKPQPRTAAASPVSPPVPALSMTGGLAIAGTPTSARFTMAAVQRRMATVFNPKSAAKGPDGRPVDPREIEEAKKIADAATEEIQREVDAAIQTFMAEHGRTLENLGSLAAMKRVRVEVDTTGKVEIAEMDLESGVMRVNALAIMERKISPREIAGLMIHEGGHGAISRVGDGFFFEKKSRHFLANCLEDPRVNEYEMARLPGSRSDFKLLYDEFFPDPAKVREAEEKGEIQPLLSLPHEEFAKGFIDLWANGRVIERVPSPEVREALERLEPIARQIWATHPDLYSPRERQVQAKQNEVYELIKQHILPDYEKFYRESLKKVENLLEQQGGGRGRPQAGHGSGRSGSSIDKEDLSDKAKKIIEERAGKLADQLEPRNTSSQRSRDIERARRRSESQPGQAGEGAYRENDFRPYDQKTFADLLKERAGRKKDAQAFYDEHPHRRYFDPVSKVAKEVAEILKQILQLDADFEYQAPPKISGTKLDIRRAVQSILHDELGILTEEDLKLFLRKKYPTRNSHKFVLLLDESGSMKGEAAQAAALQAMALFRYVMDQLRTDYAVAGFHDTADIHKSFDEKISGEKQLDAFMRELESSGGGGTNDLEGLKLAVDLFQGQEADVKTVIVVTDGAGVEQTAAYVKEMEARGIRVIAIGIGPGTEAVATVYPNFYHSPDFRDLPKTLLRILVKRLLV
ncbi:MAG TPA: VWA domain-containing protein, partial [bacterium]|nr:VWA domain-containing protein [bacterium]